MVNVMFLFKPVDHACEFAPMPSFLVVRLLLPSRVMLKSEQKRQDLLCLLFDLEQNLAAIHQQFDVVLVD